MSKEEIERMKKEAEMHAEEDKKQREKVEKINMADSMIFQTEKQMKELGDKIPQAMREDIEKAIEASHKAQDVEQIDKDMEALSAALQKAGEEIYKAQAAQQQPQGGATADAGASSAKGDNVQDVDFEEVK